MTICRGRTVWRRWVGPLVLSLVATAGAPVPLADARPVRPAAVQSPASARDQAAVLYYLTQFVDWPADAKAADFVIGVVDDMALEAALGHMLQGRTVDGRPFVVAHLSRPPDVLRCQMVYFGGARRQAIKPYLRAARSASVLTIGASPTFADLGGMITLVPTSGWPHLEINRAAVLRARLWVSAKLLRLATVIEERPR